MKKSLSSVGGFNKCKTWLSPSRSIPSNISDAAADKDPKLEVDRRIIEDNRLLLLNTWNDDFEALFQLGNDIYLSIFEVDPTSMDLFPALKKYPGTSWMNSKEFRCQALRFVQVLSHSVKYLKTTERMDPVLMAIGKRHVRLETSRGFKVFRMLNSILYYGNNRLCPKTRVGSPVWRAAINIGCDFFILP